MYAKTIISKRLIKDHMLANGLQPHTIEITKPLVKACKSAYTAYKAHLEEEKEKVVLTEHDKYAEHINSDIDKIKTQINQMTKALEMTERGFVDCVKMAEEKKDVSYVIKGNGRKRKSDQYKDSITTLEKEIESLQEKKRKL